MKPKNNLNFPQWLFILLTILPSVAFSQEKPTENREHLLMDFGWKFAYGHPCDASRDYNHGTSYFSYFAKAGYGDGPAASGFDDRAWRELDLPHDFAVEQAFSNNGSHSHGYKAIGRNFPDVSVGWYRKAFFIPESDLGRRISVYFEGVHRDAKVWINGHYLGNEPSGYSSFYYDLTAYLNYGGQNVISVRVDVTYEEGWYYEGAGIYRHVWLDKTNPLHVAQHGTFVYSNLNENRADLTISTRIKNDNPVAAACTVKQELKNTEGQVVARAESGLAQIERVGETQVLQKMIVDGPRLWSIEDPYLYTLETSVISNGEVVDQYTTPTGIRTIRFDADKGFFLNGKPVKLKGTNNHQDHAGVGTAIPDELQAFRVKKLKEMGSNAIRSSHNPASPALLDACDRLGMLVIDEHRLMGTAPFVKDQLTRMIVRDRNHPSIIVWSMGNEEWAIEGNIIGEQIIAEMQAYANKLDPTRPKNAASSGGWGNGVSKHIEVMGFNYLNHGSHDEYHKNFPNTPGIGTEEGSTNTTRGIYFENPIRQHLPAYDQPTSNGYFYSIEHCWKHYDAREFLAGMFIWTGFDYRGEPTPYGWPSISSYFGMYDVCGFPKDNVFYLKSWWGNEPVLHLLPHWNWAGKEGETIKVVAYSNCDEVELFVNRKSAGKKNMEKNSHLSWEVPYKPGSIKAVGFKNGKKLLEKNIETTGLPSQIKLEAHKAVLDANGEDLAIITVSVSDNKGRFVPDAENKISFEIEGPGKIIGVGNGDPTCLEPDKLTDQFQFIKIDNWKAKAVENRENRPETAAGYDDSGWEPAHRIQSKPVKPSAIVYRGQLELPQDISRANLNLYYKCIGNEQMIYINGQAVSENLSQKQEQHTFTLDASLVKPGKNEIAIVATPFQVRNSWDSPNTDPGIIGLKIPAEQYSRSLFSGYAQVIVQTSKEAGSIKVTAKSDGLTLATLVLDARECQARPAVPAQITIK